MQGQTTSRPATASEIVAICCGLDDRMILDIIATGASAAEVLEAHTWLMADDQLGAELKRRPSGRVGQVCDILAADQEDLEE